MCNRLDLQILGSQLVLPAQKSPRSLLKSLMYRERLRPSKLQAMIGENRQLVTDEPGEVQEDCRKFYRSVQRNLWNIPQFSEGKPEGVNM